MTFPPVDEEPAIFGKVAYSAFGEMQPPDDALHVRGIEFRLPRLKDAPALSVQIIASAGATPIAVNATPAVPKHSTNAAPSGTTWSCQVTSSVVTRAIANPVDS